MAPRDRRAEDDLIRRYAEDGARDFRDINLVEARLRGAVLPGSDFSGAVLRRCLLHKAVLNRSILRGVDLAGSNLSEAKLVGADLAGADLSAVRLSWAALTDADLSGAQLSAASFRMADLKGAKLVGIVGLPPDRTGVQVDAGTYRRSEWTPEVLAEWHAAGAKIVGLDEFPEDAQRAVLPALVEPGLSVHFTGQLTRFDRYLIDGIIVGVLGHDTDCEVVSFETGAGGAVVRLQAERLEDLLAVAEVLNSWTPPKPGTGDVDHQLARYVATNLLVDLAALLDDRLDKMRLVVLPEQTQELRDALALSPVVREMLEDQAEAHVAKKDRSVLQTNGQRVARTTLQVVTRKVTGGISSALEGAVRGALPDGDGRDDTR